MRKSLKRFETLSHNGMNRRRFIRGLGATLIGASLPKPALAINLGSLFGTVAGATAVGLFPGAAAALGGFELIKVLGKASDLEDSAKTAVQKAIALESNFDSIITQVSATLSTVQSFVQDCDNTVHEIAILVEELPTALSNAVDEVATKQAFGQLRGDCANMSALLASKNSIAANLDDLKKLSNKIVDGVSTVDSLSLNAFQSLTLTVPAIATWVQGYTAYKLFVPGNSRGASPWDHPIVSGTVLPRINELLDKIQNEQTEVDDVSSMLPLDPSVLYTFNGNSFDKSSQTFAVLYQPGQIDDKFYYTIWPDGTAPLGPTGQPLPPGTPGVPTSGTFCSLFANPPGMPIVPRYWVESPNNTLGHLPIPAGQAAMAATEAYTRLLAKALRKITAFSQVTQGWQQFQNAVNTQLRPSDKLKASWNEIPTLSV